MPKLKVLIEIEVKADRHDDDEVREAVYEKLTALMEAEELDFALDEDEDEDFDGEDD